MRTELQKLIAEQRADEKQSPRKGRSKRRRPDDVNEDLEPEEIEEDDNEIS
jgi:hypothetical protein